MKTVGILPPRADHRHWFWLAIWVPVTALAAYGLSLALPHAHDSQTDFHIFYAASQAWVHGDLAYPIRVAGTQNLNHPLLLPVFAPLTRLPLASAFLVWLGCNLIIVALCAGAIASRSGGTRTGVTLAILSLAGSAIGLGLGQVSFLLLPLFTVAWIADRDGHPVRAAVCLGVLTALKPFFGLFLLYFLLRRAWTAAGGFLAALFVAMAAGVVLVGPAEFFTWVGYLRSVDRYDNLLNGGVWGFGDRLFVHYDVHYAAAFTPLVEAPQVARIVDWSLAVIVIVGLWHTLSRRLGIDRDYALVGVAALLLSPLGWIYYQPILAGPVLVSLADRPRGRWGIWAIAAIPYTLLVQRTYGQVGTVVAGFWTIGILAALFLSIARPAGR